MEVCFVCEASYLSCPLISAVIVTKVALHSDYGDVVTCHHTSDAGAAVLTSVVMSLGGELLRANK